ncbi:transcription initiation factor IIB family protein [Halorubellus sp. PRR65]|uniref:transcription initiation factor IIB family protein n=1 Tax=Halorubellus sp. PRR65 TaxID=3098148 RepID=UPI002B25EFBE|nr:transcription initiation factor IIB family protein [Halorubellus sp. PRR65]
MYRASDRVDNEEWIRELQAVCERLELGSAARTTATDLFLSTAPEADRSKPAAIAASVYAAALLESDERSQTAVADAADVSRLSVQQRWKDVLEEAGFEPPSW